MVSDLLPGGDLRYHLQQQVFFLHSTLMVHAVNIHFSLQIDFLFRIFSWFSLKSPPIILKSGVVRTRFNLMLTQFALYVESESHFFFREIFWGLR